MTHRVSECVKGYQLIEVDNMTHHDHARHLVDTCMNKHFRYEVRHHNKVLRVELNPVNRSHRENFEECLLKCIGNLKFEEKFS